MMCVGHVGGWVSLYVCVCVCVCVPPDRNDLKLGTVVVLDMCRFWVQNVTGYGYG